MMTVRQHSRRCQPLGKALVVLLLIAAAAPGEDWLTQRQEPLLPRDLDWAPRASPPVVRPQRMRVFGTPSGLTSDILLRSDAEPEATPFNDPLPVRIDAGFAADNPFFDLRQPGDVGGLGYQRLYTEFLLLDSDSGGLTLNCHAATPAGLEFDGIEAGPTRFNPALTWFQDLGSGVALQTFVGKTMRAQMRGIDAQAKNLQYGVVVQHPLPGMETDVAAGHRVFLFLETLGRYRQDDGAAVGLPPARWDVLPGLHWQTGPNWWLSTGVLVPVGPARPDTGLWQFTCSWRF